MTVKVIPITPAYRAGWEKTFKRGRQEERRESHKLTIEGSIPSPASKDTVTICGPAIWPFDASGRVMDFTVTDRELIDGVAF